ncbi:MAG: PCMD domain-containing protein [Bacteroidetes bacterium]|nr:PCMD domain-containing protein [Bacteroidota bacterium]
MIKKFTISTILISTTAIAQVQLPNPSFENLGNPSPGISTELTGWYSNKSGSSVAQLANATCFQDNTKAHTGNNSMRLETISYFGTAVNGSASTGVINAPNFTKAQGYIGTINYSTSSDDRRYACTSKPDSIAGWYQYTPGNSTEQAKVRAILHIGDYNDPETPVSSNHPDLSANKIGDALFVSSAGVAVNSWKRFTAPFNYVSSATPAYIMVNLTSSNNQTTTVTGSKLWLDDLILIYNTTTDIKSNQLVQNMSHVFCANNNLNVSFETSSEENSIIYLYDVTGKLLKTDKIDNNKINTINLSELNSGMYIYILSGKTFQTSGKFILN